MSHGVGDRSQHPSGNSPQWQDLGWFQKNACPLLSAVSGRTAFSAVGQLARPHARSISLGRGEGQGLYGAVSWRSSQAWGSSRGWRFSGDLDYGHGMASLLKAFKCRVGVAESGHQLGKLC